AATESFRLAESLRSRSVQNALAASSARAVAENPALAELVRKSQDIDKQMKAQLGLLNNLLALPPDDRDDNAIKRLQADIGKLRVSRDAAQRDLAAKFSDYANLVEPQSPSVNDVRAVLRDDEAFVSFYFGRRTSFVWAVPKQGAVA